MQTIKDNIIYYTSPPNKIANINIRNMYNNLNVFCNASEIIYNQGFHPLIINLTRVIKLTEVDQGLTLAEVEKNEANLAVGWVVVGMGGRGEDE